MCYFSSSPKGYWKPLLLAPVYRWEIKLSQAGLVPKAAARKCQGALALSLDPPKALLSAGTPLPCRSPGTRVQRWPGQEDSPSGRCSGQSQRHPGPAQLLAPHPFPSAKALPLPGPLCPAVEGGDSICPEAVLSSCVPAHKLMRDPSEFKGS